MLENDVIAAGAYLSVVVVVLPGLLIYTVVRAIQNWFESNGIIPSCRNP
jgi:hypothetical protein